MTLRRFWEMIARWKWLVISGLVLATAAAAGAVYLTPPTQTVTSSYLFLSPVRNSDGIAGNPFLQLGNGVSQAVDVIALSLMDGETVRSYTENASDLKYVAARDAALTAPVLELSVEYTDPDVAFTTLDSLGETMVDRLEAIQQEAGAPRTQWISASPLTRDPEPELGFGDVIRNAVLAFSGVLLVTLSSVALLERRRLRKTAAVEPPADRLAVRDLKLPAKQKVLDVTGAG
jgi:uncharacterized protein involved in exopolysaccharide biosynthesis